MIGLFNNLRKRWLATLGLSLVAGFTVAGLSGYGVADEVKGGVSDADLQPLRDALSKYKNDPVAAVHDGYLSTVACVAFPDGAMGIHFVNGQLIGPTPDPMKPQALIYFPKNGGMDLAGVEWFVPVATGVKAPPVLYGQKFEGPMPGHEPLQPAGLEHYDLHLWLFQDNPHGMFAHANPDDSCDGARIVLNMDEAAAQ